MDQQDFEEQLLSDDFDRALAIRFAPKPKRQGLYLLAALNGELSRMARQTADPLLRQIKIQFWREALYEKNGAGLKLAMQIIDCLASDAEFFSSLEKLLLAHEKALLETQVSANGRAACLAALFELSSSYIDRSVLPANDHFFLLCGEVEDRLMVLRQEGMTKEQELEPETERLRIQGITASYQALCEELSALPEFHRAGILPLALVPSYLHLYQASDKKIREPIDLHPLKKAFVMWRAIRTGFRSLR